MGIKTVTFFLSLLLFLFVLELVRRERLTFKYAFAWLFFAFMGCVVALEPRWVFQMASWLGFALPSNFIFFALMGVFVFLSLLLTVFLCQQSKRNDRMAQKIAILDCELADLKRRARSGSK